ncbi:zinc-binding dehydrogenase [Paramyrothecium foliicola]|nr:zinc-binding dehydrogenase [Paramyrothecium foliicola]
MSTSNKTFIFKAIPDGVPVPGEHLVTEDRPFNMDDLAQGGIVAELLYASFDPYQRGRMRDASKKSYMPAFELGGPVYNGAVAKVVKSSNDAFAEGDLVEGMMPTAQYAVIAEPAKYNIRKLANPLDLDLALFLGPLGMPGLTAWSGLHRIGKPKKGETLFVSSAAGAVGQIVGQIAKREGLTVIGSVGSDEKLDFITKELGFDAGFNYKKEKPADALPRLAPNGIDIYFENVGGDHLEAAIDNMNVDGRIAACGMIADYNSSRDQQTGVKGLFQIVSKQITMQGFLVGRPGFGPDYAKEHREKLSQWIKEGTVTVKLSVTDGIDKAADGFVGMLQGKNFGKAVLKIK